MSDKLKLERQIELHREQLRCYEIMLGIPLNSATQTIGGEIERLLWRIKAVKAELEALDTQCATAKWVRANCLDILTVVRA